jgi:hypothetical protein
MFLYLALVGAYFAMYLKLRDKRDNGKRKTVIFATWNEANDPTSYIIEDINVTKTLQYIEETNKKQDQVELKMVHVVIAACAEGLYKMRRDIGRNVFGYFKHSTRYGITVMARTDDGQEVPMVFWDAHNTPLLELAMDYNKKLDRIMKQKDTPWQKIHARLAMLPQWMVQPALWIITYVNVNMGLPIDHFKLEAESLGHYVINDVSGLEQGFLPFKPHLRAVGMTNFGKIIKKPVVINDEIVAQDVMNTTQTGDHRFGDASIWVPMHRVLIGFIGNCAEYKREDYKENIHWTEKKAA